MASLIRRALGVLILLTVVALALSRVPDLPASALVQRWAPPPSDFIDLHGQLVHLRDEGPRHDGRAGDTASPPPLLLIHGTSASLHTWEGWAKALKGQRRVVSFDLPAFGLTGPATGRYAQQPQPYHGDHYARFVIDLMDALKIERAVLAGNSLGGEVAWRAAHLAPQRVAGLVLVDAAGPPFTPESMPIGFVVARTPVLGAISEFALPRELVAQSVSNVYGDPAKVTPALVDRYFELTLREGNRAALRERFRSMVNGEHVERLDALKLPTLILWGGRDRLIPPAIGREFQRRIAGSQLVVFDELGHVPQEEDPVRTVQPVKAFLGLAP